MADGKELREGDLEGLSRHIDQQNRDIPKSARYPKGYYPPEGRLVTDEKGRRTIFDKTPNGIRVRAQEERPGVWKK